MALQQTAVAAYQALELRDYGRVDMRLQADGRVHVIEVEPESLAQLASRVRHGCPQVRAQLPAAESERSSSSRWLEPEQALTPNSAPNGR